MGKHRLIAELHVELVLQVEVLGIAGEPTVGSDQRLG